PLAQRGYQVVAIDLSDELLAELSTHAGGLPIRSVQDDFVEYLKRSDEKAGIIVCMGDTITHLESIDRVSECISQCARHLLPGGKIILTFRDYSVPLEKESRFIPVRSDADTIFTCFVEYFDTYVEVYDILHEREGSGWSQKISSYRKLRLARPKIESFMTKNGFSVSHTTDRGMITLVGQK
ncbi:MAG TPA: class I SAM-dependent methyltransferase, partial [Spirochaetota bacterium]